MKFLTASRLWNGVGFVENPVIGIEDGRIHSISTVMAGQLPNQSSDENLDFPGATLAPAFFDVHIHGSAGHDVMVATSEALSAIGQFLASHGTGSYLATTVTAPLDETLRALEGLAKLIDNPQAIESASVGRPTSVPIGIHLEGPFLSHVRRGVHPEKLLLEPDTHVFDQLYDASGGHVRLMTIAPELNGATELTAHATARGVRVSMGHSNANGAETHAAIAAGAVSATHTFNAMRPLHHRDAGILDTVLTTDSLYSELICDGVHTTPGIVKLWWRAKGPARAILVTDAISAAGMPDGEYSLGGIKVTVANGIALAGGVLSGSLLSLDRALENLIRFTGAPLDQAFRLVAVNPAAMTGFSNSVGSVSVGRAAHLVAMDGAGKLIAAIHNGRLV
jgi:N-acetylglucosamine-6-phosphate deacetylase